MFFGPVKLSFFRSINTGFSVDNPSFSTYRALGLPYMHAYKNNIIQYTFKFDMADFMSFSESSLIFQRLSLNSILGELYAISTVDELIILSN